MTLRRPNLKTIAVAVAVAVAVAAPGASVASATPMTYQERQAIASRGIGAPVPPAEPVQPPLAKSSDGTDWGAIAALVAVRQRHTPATPS